MGLDDRLRARGLPERCAAILPSSGEVIIIRRGVDGYYPYKGHRSAGQINELLEVSEAQKEAMIAGSMFGWNVPGADPALQAEMMRRKRGG